MLPAAVISDISKSIPPNCSHASVSPILHAGQQVNPGWQAPDYLYLLDFNGAKNDGGDGDKWSYKMCKVPVKSS